MSKQASTASSSDRFQSWASLPGRIVGRYRETARERPDEEIKFRVLAAFIGTFTSVRIITHGIRGDWLPLKNVQLGGKKGGHPLHIHHLVWGILTLTGCGYGALMRTEPKWRRRLAPVYGAGAALTFDEFALWLRLEDDYWNSAGRTSVDAVIVLSALLGVAVASPLFWQRAFDEVARTVPPVPLTGKVGSRGLRGA
ncbi:integral membrane protein [mine drainage metagenome]|uniref:Integral membrane protein n=1 Tax=mine drainage metagenome TaxID=410659 RepID=T1BEC2_9ZZZZ